MPLVIQIYSLLFSFGYGIFFFILLELNCKFIYSNNIVMKVLSTFIFVIFNTLLYFIGLKKINNGIIHIYFLLMILFSYTISYLVYRKFIKK